MYRWKEKNIRITPVSCHVSVNFSLKYCVVKNIVLLCLIISRN